MKNNVTLIGMPSAGKSTVGVLLAKRLGYSFIDVDLLIQEQEGKRLREIIEEQGLDGFLDVENRVNGGGSRAGGHRTGGQRDLRKGSDGTFKIHRTGCLSENYL